MVSLYTDEARHERYDKLRKQSERCEKIFSKVLLAVIVLSLTETVGNLVSGPMAWMLGADTASKGICVLFAAAAMVLSVAAVLSRSYLLIGAAIIADVLCCAAGWLTAFQIGAMNIIPLGIAMPSAFTWEKLKNEEGFPRFVIDYEEHEIRTKSQVSYIEHRAVEEGIRTEQEQLDPDAQMTDIMDAGSETQQLGAKLHSYHERSRRGVAEVMISEPHSGRMDEIEEQPGLEEL